MPDLSVFDKSLSLHGFRRNSRRRGTRLGHHGYGVGLPFSPVRGWHRQSDMRHFWRKLTATVEPTSDPTRIIGRMRPMLRSACVAAAGVTPIGDHLLVATSPTGPCCSSTRAFIRSGTIRCYFCPSSIAGAWMLRGAPALPQDNQ
jgi:hypothetical protein